MIRKKTNAHLYVAILVLLMIVGTLIASQLKQQASIFDIGDYSAISVDDAEAAYKNSKSTKDLLLLLKTLAYRQEVLGEKNLKNKIANYGTLLLDRAKTQDLDLSKLDEEHIMLQLLRIIRQAGAH
ncbi:MAG TPA: hypothetical protein GXZ86_06475 [Clostridiales bacterium]|jgi:hypothetical protein|nr:hypothetical protein [Clostridiales bacterium]